MISCGVVCVAGAMVDDVQEVAPGAAVPLSAQL